jgi:putative transferase (TIGR04331 family)
MMLGPWCVSTAVLLNPRAPQAESAPEIAPFHWDDRAKLHRDYVYLKGLHQRLLDALAVSLDCVHGVSHSRRHWQILLDPWLMAWVGVLFDRWEALRLALASGEAFDTASVGKMPHEPPFAHADFVEQAISDEWNLATFAAMLGSRYARQVHFRDGCAPRPAATRYAVRTGGRAPASFGQRLATQIDGLLAKISVRNRVVFLDSYFGSFALLQLSLKMGLVPRRYLQEFPLIQCPEALPGDSASRGERSRLRVDLPVSNDFEEFLLSRLTMDLPSSLVEHYAALARRAASVKLDPALIVTANAHWNHVLAKFWMARQVERGSKLFVLEHGGSFPARHELFDFEEDIADVRGSWFRPYHEKHVQVPPSKLVGRDAPARRASRGEWCLLIGNESPRWVFRVHFYPMAAQFRHSFALTTAFVDALRGPSGGAVRIRPARDQGWNTAAAFAERFGEGALLREGSLPEAMAAARLIVCTYPETTFSEAMASGRPTVLLYPPQVYERHPIADELLRQMRDARIIFHDARAAASHVAAVWEDCAGWWESQTVTAARSAFFDTALRIRGDWLSEWAALLRSFDVRH